MEDHRIQEALNLHRQGVTQAEICAQLKVSRQTVWRWLKAARAGGDEKAEARPRPAPTRARQRPRRVAPSIATAPDEDLEPLRPAVKAALDRVRRHRLASVPTERLEAAGRVWALGLGDERAAIAMGVAPGWLRDELVKAAQDFAAGRDTNAVRLAMLRELAPLELTARLGDRMVALAFDDDPKVALKAASWLLERREAAFAGPPAVQVNFAAQVDSGRASSLRDLLEQTRQRREAQAHVVDVEAVVGAGG